ncbi:MAG: type II toxin-antitoxin system PemK/MazF family toxin [Bacteroidota bacterium]
MSLNIQRGQVYGVIPDIAIGEEIKKPRPCVVVSSNVINTHSKVVVVCPITDAVGKGESRIHIYIKSPEGGLKKDSLVSCIQVKAVSNERLMDKWGELKVETMQKIDLGMCEVLNLQ